jgi:hypothetical protein
VAIAEKGTPVPRPKYGAIQSDWGAIAEILQARRLRNASTKGEGCRAWRPG